MQFPLRERLTNAIINDTDDDIAELKALVCAEVLAAPGNQGSAAVTAGVVHELKRLYSDAAPDNYRAVAKQFDNAAKRFTDLAELVDVEGDAAALLNEPDKTRQAYQDAESFANQVTRLLPAMAAAMTLATGVDVFLGHQQLMLPLCVDVDSGKRKDLWTAWDVKNTGRTGRWGALHAAGATIRAHPLDVRLTEHRRPLPYEPDDADPLPAYIPVP
ncbi:MAG: hypothetical protein WBZ37_25325, partial [Mycobacterium sp.]